MESEPKASNTMTSYRSFLGLGKFQSTVADDDSLFPFSARQVGKQVRILGDVSNGGVDLEKVELVALLRVRHQRAGTKSDQSDVTRCLLSTGQGQCFANGASRYVIRARNLLQVRR